MADEDYCWFEQAIDYFQRGREGFQEEDLKRLVSEGEIRAFRRGQRMILKRGDIEELARELGIDFNGKDSYLGTTEEESRPEERSVLGVESRMSPGGESYLETTAEEAAGERVYDGTQLGHETYDALITGILQRIAPNFMPPNQFDEFERDLRAHTSQYHQKE